MMEDSKVCVKCGLEKPVSEFRPRKGRRKPHTICSSCQSLYQKAYYAARRRKILDRQREHYLSVREEVLEKHREYHATHKSERSIQKAAYHKAHPVGYDPGNRVKLNAHKKVFRALEKGLLVKRPCVCCGSEDAQAHHPDYSKPLDVIWLCCSCHFRLHALQRAHWELAILSIG